jgi:hypothetical protein
MHWSTLINSHVTLVFIWLEHESWGNFHANSHFSAALINAHPRLTGASIYTSLWEYYCLWSPFRRGWVRCVTFNLITVTSHVCIVSDRFLLRSRNASRKFKLSQYRTCSNCSECGKFQLVFRKQPEVYVIQFKFRPKNESSLCNIHPCIMRNWFELICKIIRCPAIMS